MALLHCLKRQMKLCKPNAGYRAILKEREKLADDSLKCYFSGWPPRSTGIYSDFLILASLSSGLGTWTI